MITRSPVPYTGKNPSLQLLHKFSAAPRNDGFPAMAFWMRRALYARRIRLFTILLEALFIYF
jgi:hypothetical protein